MRIVVERKKDLNLFCESERAASERAASEEDEIILNQAANILGSIKKIGYRSGHDEHIITIERKENCYIIEIDEKNAEITK